MEIISATKQLLQNKMAYRAINRFWTLNEKLRTSFKIPFKGIQYNYSKHFIELNVYGETFALLDKNANIVYVLLDYFDFNCHYNRMIVKDFIEFHENTVDEVVTYRNV